MWKITSLKIAVALRETKPAMGASLAAGKMFFLVKNSPENLDEEFNGVLAPLDREERHGFWGSGNPAIVEGLDYSIVPGNFPIVNTSLPGTLWMGFGYVYCPKRRIVHQETGTSRQTIALMESF